MATPKYRVEIKTLALLRDTIPWLLEVCPVFLVKSISSSYSEGYVTPLVIIILHEN